MDNVDKPNFTLSIGYVERFNQIYRQNAMFVRISAFTNNSSLDFVVLAIFPIKSVIFIVSKAGLMNWRLARTGSFQSKFRSQRTE
jgi:hypothetical protein